MYVNSIQSTENKPTYLHINNVMEFSSLGQRSVFKISETH